MKKHTQSLLTILSFIIISSHIHSMEIVTQPTTEHLIEQLEDEYSKFLKEFAEKLQPPNEIYVPLWNTNSITSKPSKKKVKLTISPFRLGNCLAIALYIKYNNKDQYAGITHYPASPFDKLAESVKSLCRQAISTQTQKKHIDKIKLFIIVPGKYEKNGNATIHDLYREHCHTLDYVTKKILEPIKPVKIEYIPYNSSQNCLDRPKDFQITLYPDKASFTTSNKKMNLL